jgi:hypothetical protein
VRQIHPALSLEELAALVCSTLERHGVSVVLSGGSVVSIYSNNAYQSNDLDFIQTGFESCRPNHTPSDVTREQLAARLCTRSEGDRQVAQHHHTGVHVEPGEGDDPTQTATERLYPSSGKAPATGCIAFRS